MKEKVNPSMVQKVIDSAAQFLGRSQDASPGENNDVSVSDPEKPAQQSVGDVKEAGSINIFISFSHGDARFLNESRLLPSLVTQLEIEATKVWYDSNRLLVGDSFQEQIIRAIDRAHIAVLFVSQDYLVSEFVRNVELPRIEARAERNELVVIPILLGHCAWQNVSLICNRQILPDAQTPLINLLNSPAEFDRARYEIYTALLSNIRKVRGHSNCPHESENVKMKSAMLSSSLDTSSTKRELVTKNIEKPVIFISFSSEDADWFKHDNFVQKLMKAVSYDEEAEFLYDKGCLEGGASSREEIEDAIDRAHIALLLVSQNYLVSENVRRIELPRIESHVTRNELIVMVIVVGYCNWKDIPFIAKQELILPPEKRPLVEHQNNPAEWDKAQYELTTALQEQISKMRKAGLLREKTAGRHDSIPFEAYSGTKPFLFVSYAHKDSALVFSQLRSLHELGYNIWYDEGIDPGNEWPEEIANALQSASYFLVFISHYAVQSKNVRNEINFAVKRNKPFVAVHLEETTLPAGLDLQIGVLQAIMKYRMSDDSYLRKLQKTLPRTLCENA